MEVSGQPKCLATISPRNKPQYPLALRLSRKRAKSLFPIGNAITISQSYVIQLGLQKYDFNLTATYKDLNFILIATYTDHKTIKSSVCFNQILLLLTF
jgi:hypothetical protein